MVDENMILKLYYEGLNSSKIAEIMGIGRKTVYKYLNKNNLKSHNNKPLSPRKITENDIEKIIELYNNGYTLHEIVDHLELNCTDSAIRGLLIRRNVKLRNRGKQSCFNENYFEKIDDEHKAYWLGFIYADGNVTKNRLRIEVQSKDIELIEKIKSDLDSTNKIIEANNGTKNNVAIGFCSDKLVADLKKYDVVENKTFKLNHIPDIPDKLIKHFIRGYFDGDGTVYINSKSNKLRIGFYGTKELLLSIQNHLHNELNTSVNLIYEKVGCWLLSYARSSDINKIYNYLYIDSEIFLSRKKDKFEENL